MFDVAAVFDSDESGESLGSRLAAARKAKDLPIEKAAHDTRIRVQRLREIEHDDFSQFSHPSYARMFLTDYARYLGMDVDAIKHLLPPRRVWSSGLPISRGGPPHLRAQENPPPAPAPPGHGSDHCRGCHPGSRLRHSLCHQAPAARSSRPDREGSDRER